MMRKAFSLQALAAGVLAAFVGFASSFAVIIAGLTAVGASQAEAASGLMALSVSMGLCAVVLSLKTRQPISIAWSTPGAALLATTGPTAGGFPETVGAFLITALPTLVPILITDVFGPLQTTGNGPALAQIIYGLLVIVFITSSPQGIVGLLRNVVRWAPSLAPRRFFRGASP